MWTCPACSRTFATTHQWHSCIELTLEAKLADASDHAVALYREIEAAFGACGEFRIHPQKTRIAFIATMTFASVKLARRWIDLSLITPTPIDDPRLASLECYGPTSFANGLRITAPDDIDRSVRDWACISLRRGRRESLDPSAHVEPLVGRALELVLVPLRCEVIERGGDPVLRLPRYAAEVFEAHPAVRGKLGREPVTGVVESDETGWWFRAAGGALATRGLAIGQTADAFLRADL